jgi:hypothetical protein
MHRNGKYSVGKYFTLNDRCSSPIRSSLQPLASGNQTLGIVCLFGSTGTAVHDAQGQWCHSTIELGKLSQQLAILPDHKASPGSPHRASSVLPKAAAS